MEQFGTSRGGSRFSSWAGTGGLVPASCPGRQQEQGLSSARHRGAAHHTSPEHVLGRSGCTERPAHGAVLSCGPDRGP